MGYFSEPVPFSCVAGGNRFAVNGRLRPPGNDLNFALIGTPRRSFSEHGQEPDDPAFLSLIATADFGPFRATGLRPALKVLTRVMEEVAFHNADLHRRLSTSAMLCCRMARGDRGVSNHSWGIAIDLKIDGIGDTRGDDCVQRGLLEIAPIFARHMFYWGAAFQMEEAMHFEASEQLVRLWAARGELASSSGGLGGGGAADDARYRADRFIETRARFTG